MWRSFSFIILALCIANGAITIASAEVYSWVDEHGKQHFGDKVPEQYQKISKEVDTSNINSVPLSDINQANQNTSRQIEKDNNKKELQPPKAQASGTSNSQSCQQKTAAYNKSLSCYSRCRNAAINNVSKCGHCQNLKKPDC
jgi:hypothetical protein